MTTTTIDNALDQAGAGRFQRRLLAIFGLVWAADAMQVMAIGFTAPSIAKSFGLTIPQAAQYTGTVFFIGMFLGALVFGRIADRIGRRNVLMLTVACDAVFGMASAFAPSLEWLLVARLLTGMAVGGTLPVDYALMAEFLPAQKRGRWLVWLEGFWAIGTVAVALTVWLAVSAGATEPFRIIFAAAALPAVVGIFLRLWVPESPMFLLRKGDQRGAVAVLDRVRRANGVAALPADTTLSVPAPTAGSLFAPELVRTTLTIMALWFLVSLSYYGVFVWLPGKLATEGMGFVRGYGFLVLLALAQLPGYALAAIGVERIGRRRTLTGFLILSAAGCLLFTLANSPVFVATALMVMSFALLGTWGALYATTPELFPTTLRGSGMGLAGATARAGGILAPLMMRSVVERDFALAIGFFAAFLALAAIVAHFGARETRGQSIA